MQRLTLQHIFFLWDERLYHDLYFDYIFIDLGNDRQSDGIHGNPRETELLWSCSDMYFASITYHLPKSIANKSLSITAILSRHATTRRGTWEEKTASWYTNSLGAQPITVLSRKVPPQKGAKLRDKTNSCCTGLTCRHNSTKFWYCYKT